MIARAEPHSLSQPGRGTHLGVVKAVLLLHSVPTQCVVIKAGVFKEADPLLPARRYVGAVVFVKVLPKESWRGEGPGGHVSTQRAKAFSVRQPTAISKPWQAQSLATALPSEPRSPLAGKCSL